MATSESDDFESADEELSHDTSHKRAAQRQQWSSPTTIGSESDDDTEFVPQTPRTNTNYAVKAERFSSSRTAASAGERTPAKETENKGHDTSIKDTRTDERDDQLPNTAVETAESITKTITAHDSPEVKSAEAEINVVNKNIKEQEHDKTERSNDTKLETTEKNIDVETCSTAIKPTCSERGRNRSQRRSEGSRQLGAKRLGTRIVQNSNVKPNVDIASVPDNIEEEDLSARFLEFSINEATVKEELTESDMPEEMKSNKKFKEVFTPQGWEGLGDDIDLPEELTEQKIQPLLEKLSSAVQEDEDSADGWGGWGSWGVSSLITSATAGVSTLTSHVSHGLTFLEESMGVPEPSELAKMNNEDIQESPISEDDTKSQTPEETQSQSSFGFGNFLSGVSSITKLVESTSSKVMFGGLDTLEAIGKKTMEVLQEGDPGLKKKRAFFTNESDKPILSHVLREAKEKADAAEKTIEEKQKARKVHFESLFDDYQGLVHLEALEMLSKQSNIKIQQHLVSLDSNELNSVQETLEEVKELCDLGEDDEHEEDEVEKDLKLRLQEACNDLGVSITYEKLCTVSEESQSYLASPQTHNDQDIFQCAISALAQFTAFSVERFHKTAELLLVKERRSTVNEADALVQLTRILSNHIGVLANSYCSSLNELVKTLEKSDDISANITTIFMEASNASSYIQDAFRLLIPIIQVGAV